MIHVAQKNKEDAFPNKSANKENKGEAPDNNLDKMDNVEEISKAPPPHDTLL